MKLKLMFPHFHVPFPTTQISTLPNMSPGFCYNYLNLVITIKFKKKGLISCILSAPIHNILPSRRYFSYVMRRNHTEDMTVDFVMQDKDFYEILRDLYLLPGYLKITLDDTNCECII